MAAANDTPEDELRYLLANYAPSSPSARLEAVRFDEVLAQLEEPFARSEWAHVTASALVVHRGRILMHRHKLSGLLLPPGGHVEEGESIPMAAHREVLEETGVRCRVEDEPRVGALFAGPTARCGIHLDVTLIAAADSDALQPLACESQDVHWLDLTEIQVIEGIPPLVRDAATELLREIEPAGDRSNV